MSETPEEPEATPEVIESTAYQQHTAVDCWCGYSWDLRPR